MLTFRCKKCRASLAYSNARPINHAPGKGQLDFTFRKRSDILPPSPSSLPSSESDLECQRAYFFPPPHPDEDPSLMTSFVGSEVEGKLVCQKCGAKVGQYKWQGMQCACGSWICPAFELQSARCDVIKQV